MTTDRDRVIDALMQCQAELTSIHAMHGDRANAEAHSLGLRMANTVLASTLTGGGRLTDLPNMTADQVDYLRHVQASSGLPPDDPRWDERVGGVSPDLIQAAREAAEQAAVSIVEWMMCEGLMRHRTAEDDGILIEGLLLNAMKVAGLVKERAAPTTGGEAPGRDDPKAWRDVMAERRRQTEVEERSRTEGQVNEHVTDAEVEAGAKGIVGDWFAGRPDIDDCKRAVAEGVLIAYFNYQKSLAALSASPRSSQKEEGV